MKALKLAVIPAALLATSAFAEDVVVDQQVIAEPVAVSTTTYNPDNGIVKNTTTQLVDGTKTLFNKAIHPAAISAEVGTLGYGGNIAWGVNDKTELVAGWNGGKIDGDVDLDTNDSYINWKKVLGDEYQDFKGTLDYKADLNNPYLGVNMRPWSNGFTVGTGVIFQDNEISAKLKNDKSTNFTVNGVKYTVNTNSKVDVSVKPRNDIAPYLTIGYRPNISERWGLFGEVGAAYMGKSEATVNVDGSVSIQDPTVNAQVNDAKQKLKDDLTHKLQNKNVIYPIAKVGLTFRF